MLLFRTILVAFCASTLSLSAQQGGGIKVSTLGFEQKGDSVYLTYRLTPQSKLHRWDGYALSCQIEQGDSLREVDALHLMGTYLYRCAQRKPASQPQFYKWSTTHPSLDITSVFAFSEWMRGESVHYRLLQLDCCNKPPKLLYDTVSFAMQMEPIPLPRAYEMQLKYTYITPEAASLKEMSFSGSAFLSFAVGKSQLIPDFQNNQFELSKIHAVIDSVSANKYAKMTAVELVGYASIEGSSASNLRLSLARAEAVRRFLQIAYPRIPSAIIRAQAGGEDWKGLQALTQQMSLDEVSSILNLPITESAKKSRLQSLASGSVYRMLSREVFPQLRRVDYSVRFTVQAFSVTEGKDLLKRAPGNLSLNELFLIANSYLPGSEEFREVFDIAVRLYPNSTIARINAASIALERKDLQRASQYLRGLESEPMALNNLGLLYLAKGNEAEAVTLLKKACSLGNMDSCHNMDEFLLYQSQEKARAEVLRKNGKDNEN